MRLTTIVMSLLLLLAFTGCTIPNRPSVKIEREPIPEDAAVATFAGGCFWCSESAYQEQEGVYEVISGYSGGTKENPTYEEVSRQATDHVEAVQVYYNPEIISYEELLTIYWQHIDPTDGSGQFADKGTQYLTHIFYNNEEERVAAEKSKKDLEESGKFSEPIVVQITEFTSFYPAEEYHQDYYLKQSTRYKTYARGSGRVGFIEKYWK